MANIIGSDSFFDWPLLVTKLGALGWQDQRELELKAEIVLEQEIMELPRSHKMQFLDNDKLFMADLKVLIDKALKKYGVRNITDLTSDY